MLAEFIKDLRELGVELRGEGDRLVCDAPKGVLTETLRSEIRERKEAILKFLNEAIRVESTDIPLAPVPRHSRMPVTRSQERLLFVDQLDPNKSFYNLPGAFRLSGKLDFGALERALNEIVRRHEILRATFHWDQGEPVQQINPSFVLNIPIISFADRSPNEREAAMISFLETEGDRPFNLAEGPLVRAALIELADTEQVLFFMTHHVVWDGWSFDILLNELAALYTAYVKGSPSPLPELPIQYVDFAVWHRQWMSGKRLQCELDYWHEQLKGELPVLQMPTDYPRPPRMTYNGAREWFSLSQGTLTALSALGRKEGATLFMLLLAAFKTLLHRYTGQEDILVGSPIQGRTRPEIENLIGFFVNTLVLRTQVDSTLSFRELLARVRNVCLGAYSHSHAPFEILVNEHESSRDPSRTPLTQTFFTYQDTGTRSPMMADISVKSVIRGIHQVETDLSLWVRNYGDRLDGAIDYRTDLFDASTIKRMLTHFETLLISILENPGQKISQLTILPEAECEQLIRCWNNTYQEFGSVCSIQQLFETQVVRSPDATAVIFENQQINYRELNSRANQLAHYLQRLGVGPDIFVGISLERSVEMVVGLLGILKAGGAYVPLDPDFPQERLKFMVEDARLKVLLTQSSLRTMLPADATHIVEMDKEWETIASEQDTNLLCVVKSEDLAYLIYTSGSTGKPKGVQVPHRAAVNFLMSMAREPGLSNEDTLLAVTTLSFDISVLELFLPLAVGAKLVVVSREVSADGGHLLEALRASNATIMQATPATWRMLLTAGWEQLQPLKVLCGGEALSSDLAGKLLKKASSLWNMYGPTETTVWSTYYKVIDADGPVPIGHPIANTALYVLDKNKQLVPIGIPGELYIGGTGVTRGYLNRPELTADRFITDPYTNETGARLYRTGDLVRYRSDGNIQYLNRLDNQVKIRGFRIELGEIEAALVKQDAVKQAVTVVREDYPGDQRLVAYYVTEVNRSITTNDLRKFLRSELPAYMIPQHFAALQTLPMTPNRKVDRKALPPPIDMPQVSDDDYVAPRTHTEVLLAEIWKDILGIDQVSVYDNFFDLGGHSLLSMQAIARIESQTGVRLDPFIFVTENLGQISAKCEEYVSKVEVTKEKNEMIGSNIFKKIKRTLLRTVN
jgi:amino acid adenylation domain-containing protein